MDEHRFDRLTRALGNRLSRRTALRGGGASLAAGGFAAAGLGVAGAGQATPAATPVATPVASPVAGDGKTFYMFVQSFVGGALVPKAGQAGVYELTLRRGLGSTVYFSDRPERIVGTVPTGTFLDGLGFTPGNPPNAALVADAGGGNEEILVVELLDPHFDEATFDLTYDIRILDDFDRVDLRFAAAPAGERHLGGGREYGASHLFIDDCPNVSGCLRQYPQGREPVDLGPVQGGGQCWHGSCFCCKPCNGNTQSDYAAYCNATYAECENSCFVDMGGI